MTDLDTTGAVGSSSRGIGALLGGLGLVAALTVGALALDSGTPAAASGLEQFDSCAELQAWTEDLQAQSGVEVSPTFAAEEDARAEGSATGSVAAGGGVAADVAESTAAAPLASDGGATGGTNTVVEGIDEIDVIDRVGDDRLLVSRNGVLALVELSSLTAVAEVRGIPYDARISAADGVVFVAGSSYDDTGRGSTDVRRIRLDGDALVEDGSWSTPGYLLDARRTGDRLHVVVVDQPYEVGVVPFEGGPVPCDQVWRPVEPATSPAATLVATLPAGGSLAPTAIAEITGAGGNLLVTDGAAYVVTETYGADDGSVTSGIHRFDLATLAPTGSGAVPGSVAGPFALSEHEGHLRVATSRNGGFGGRPIPIEGDGGIGGVAVDVAEAAPAPAQAPAEEVPEATTTTVEPTEPTEPTVTLPVEETTTTVPETTTTVEETTTTEAPTTTVPADESALAEVFVLDTEGDLDVVGTTGRFGREYETIQGVRFVGDVAYVVTFLQTDPFWVVDLADPTRPAVVGELQIPGFSGYLHPVGDDRVVGFGPDGEGQVAARLFDVSDPAAPSVIDEITLGDDSPVAFDHHAFVSLGEARFAVPVSDYPEYVGGDCVVVGEPVPQVEPLPADDPASTSGGGATGIAVGEPVPDCAPPEPIGGGSGAVVLEVVDGRLQEVERPTIERADLYAERVVQAPDGTWILLSYDRLASTEGGRELVLPIG